MGASSTPLGMVAHPATAADLSIRLRAVKRYAGYSIRVPAGAVAG